MTDTTSLFVLTAAAIGLAQVIDCGLLLTNRKMTGWTATVFSAVEWLWGVACVFVIFERPADLPLWLPLAFVAYLVLAVARVVQQARAGRSMEDYELTFAQVLAGGIFGAFYALASFATFTGLV